MLYVLYTLPVLVLYWLASKKICRKCGGLKVRIEKTVEFRWEHADFPIRFPVTIITSTYDCSCCKTQYVRIIMRKASDGEIEDRIYAKLDECKAQIPSLRH